MKAGAECVGPQRQQGLGAYRTNEAQSQRRSPRMIHEAVIHDVRFGGREFQPVQRVLWPVPDVIRCSADAISVEWGGHEQDPAHVACKEELHLPQREFRAAIKPGAGSGPPTSRAPAA